MAQPTPHYNSSILEDMAIESTSEMLKEALLENEAMRDAVLLLKVRSISIWHQGHYWIFSTKYEDLRMESDGDRPPSKCREAVF